MVPTEEKTGMRISSMNLVKKGRGVRVSRRVWRVDE